MRKKKTQSNKIVRLDALKHINLNAAGIDVGDSQMYVAVPEDRDEQFVRVFGTFTRDLIAIVQWLKDCNITTIAMESTGVYWIPLFEILVEHGFDVLLVDARKIKNVSGRKTDVQDCQWIQQLHTYGLLHGSFIPEMNIRALRDLIRHRANLLRYRAAHIQHMQKILQQMNLKLTNVISDITGTTGMHILRAIVAGKTDPEYLSSFRDPHCKKSQTEIELSLQGNYRVEYIFQLKQMLDLYDYYSSLVAQLDTQTETMYAQLPPLVNPNERPLKPLKRNVHKKAKNAPTFDLRTQLYRICGVDLVQVDGLNTSTVQDIITDIGTDMSKWKTSKHFCAWLRLAPNNKITGGKIFLSHTPTSKNRANKALRLAAFSLANAKCALGAFYRRIRAKYGAPMANIATAHKLARIIYKMLKDKVDYVDLGENYYNENYKARLIRNLHDKAKTFGFQLIPSVTL